MPQVVYVGPDGAKRAVAAADGDSVMVTAVRNGVTGIIGECGGNMSCATCHVWVRADFQEAVGPPGDFEDDVLDLAVTERRDGSRLSCQIPMAASLDGLVVELPPEQP